MCIHSRKYGIINNNRKAFIFTVNHKEKDVGSNINVDDQRKTTNFIMRRVANDL